MKCDIILAGVGGQGVLSLSAVIASGALKQGLHVKQSEVHGMAQRGGAVVAHLRLADHPVASALIPRGTADLIVSVEPLEGLRCLEYLAPHGALLTSIEPMVNIPDYPELPELLAALRTSPRVHLVDTRELARQAGSARAANMVMVGAAVHWLPVARSTLETHIREAFARKGDAVVEANLRAFRLGMEVMECSRP
jgi:indolepyruvate ferredoxin oxidoreductase beta subunit